MEGLSKMLLLSMFLLVSVATGTDLLDKTGCPTQFQGKCSCGMAKYPKDPRRPDAPSKFIVNCTNTGFTNTSMLRHLPSQTEILIFSGNKLGELPMNILGSTDYNYLDLVDLSNNGITFISGKTFHRVFNVRTLILNHNDIEISERSRPRMFSNFDSLENLHLTNAFTEEVNSSYYLLSLEDIFYESDLGLLVKIHLEQNEIYTIGKNASIFCQLPSLEQLYLGDNRLSDLDFSLDCMPDIHYIDLQHNSINQLSVEAMDRLDKFVKKSNITLELQQNPFMCDCYSSRFIKWLKETKVTLRDFHDYRCADGIPRSTVGRSLEHLKPNELKCPTQIEGHKSVHNTNEDHKCSHAESQTSHNYHIHIDGYSASTVGTLTFFLVFATAILLAVAYYHRNKIIDTVLPYWDHVTRKVGYSGLANEEIPKVVAV